MLDDGGEGKQCPDDVEKDYGGQSLDRGRPDQTKAGDSSDDVKPPPLNSKKKSGYDDGNFVHKTNKLHGVCFVPILFVTKLFQNFYRRMIVHKNGASAGNRTQINGLEIRGSIR